MKNSHRIKYYIQTIEQNFKLLCFYLGIIINPLPVKAENFYTSSNNSIIRVQTRIPNLVNELIQKPLESKNNSKLIPYRTIYQITLSETFIIPYWLSVVESEFFSDVYNSPSLYHRMGLHIIIQELVATELSVRLIFEKEHVSKDDIQHIINLIDIHANNDPKGRAFIQQIIENAKFK